MSLCAFLLSVEIARSNDYYYYVMQNKVNVLYLLTSFMININMYCVKFLSKYEQSTLAYLKNKFDKAKSKSNFAIFFLAYKFNPIFF